MSDDILDLKEALERVQDDQALLLELFDIFTEDFPQKRTQLDMAVKTKNSMEVRHIAHALKGASSNLSARKIYTSLAKLEKMGEEGNIATAAETLSQIDQEYKELQDYIGKIRTKLK
ncbi:MAG: hypothetical protein A2Z88_02690 [Omnitrophica WOR_2 bacterium GWA2_47_8]|nr:MAG: hypothetical protein A2Z88_02690 [Omnitrophica WOR_2 bacterium GWA2_47_8]